MSKRKAKAVQGEVISKLTDQQSNSIRQDVTEGLTGIGTGYGMLKRGVQNAISAGFGGMALLATIASEIDEPKRKVLRATLQALTGNDGTPKLTLKQTDRKKGTYTVQPSGKTRGRGAKAKADAKDAKPGEALTFTEVLKMLAQLASGCSPDTRASMVSSCERVIMEA